jgi:hypothetical protein
VRPHLISLEVRSTRRADPCAVNGRDPQGSDKTPGGPLTPESHINAKVGYDRHHVGDSVQEISDQLIGASECCKQIAAASVFKEGSFRQESERRAIRSPQFQNFGKANVTCWNRSDHVAFAQITRLGHITSRCISNTYAGLGPSGHSCLRLHHLITRGAREGRLGCPYTVLSS